METNPKVEVFRLSFILIFLFIFLNSASAAAFELGGKASLINTWSYLDSDFDGELGAELELECYLPYDYPLDVQNRVVITARDSELDLWFKKLYLRQKLGPFTAKIGRQPVSWSYGALINPVDYTLGAENLDEESRAKFVDGVEIYYPINWGSGISFITTDLEGEKDHKWALRGRTTYAGYDLTAAYIKTPSSENSGDLDRYGLTAKGDLGPLGVYGAYGLWENDSIDYDIYQLGADYSYHFLRGSQLYLQGEYLIIDGAEADEGFDFFAVDQVQSQSETPGGDVSDKLEFINTNISYEIDEFSSIALMTVSYLGDGSTLFIPVYNYIFSSNTALEVRGMFYSGAEREVLGGGAKTLEFSLSCSF